MEIYLVGGAVRDQQLGLPVEERDWVVVGSTPEEMLKLGYRQVGKDFPVFLHPKTGEEYALARTERKTAPGYRGFAFHTSPDISLEEDLKRRDLSINAMAQTMDGKLIDPYGGLNDLREGLLRHVSPAFSEDPVRILRVARFAARFGRYGFHLSHATNRLMRDMVAAGEVEHLVAERVWAELVKALATDMPERFFHVLRGCGALAVLFVEIDRQFESADVAHTSDSHAASLRLLHDAAARTDDTVIRFGSLLWSLDRNLSRSQRIEQSSTLCNRLKAPNDFTRFGLLAIEQENNMKSRDADALVNAMQASGAFRDTHRWKQLLELYSIAGVLMADDISMLNRARDQAAAVNAAQFKNQGLKGPALGDAIKKERVRLLEQLVSSSRSSSSR